jgi:hypothetical protein
VEESGLAGLFLAESWPGRQASPEKRVRPTPRGMAASRNVISASGSTQGLDGRVAFNLRRFPFAGFDGISPYSTAVSRICER